MLKLALSRECRARGRLQHKPIAAAESRLRERRRGDAKTGSPQSNYNGRLQHKPIGVAESPATLKKTRNPITGVPRAREAAAQTHSCCGISTAGAQARRCKNLFSASNYNGSAARAGGCGTRESRRGRQNWPSAIRSRECAPSVRRVRGRLQHKLIGAAESPATGAQARRCKKKRALRNPITGAPRRNLDCGSAAKTDSPQSNYNGRLQHKPIGVAESPATGESRRGDVTKNPQSDHGSATCAGGCSTNP